MPNPIRRAMLASLLLPITAARAQPAPAPAGAWVVQALGGTALAGAGRRPDLTFGPEGRAHGSSGCNRFAGSYGLSGEGLRFGPLAGTRMACSVAQSATEAAMTAALDSITRFDVTEDGQVLFYAGETAILTTRAGR